MNNRKPDMILGTNNLGVASWSPGAEGEGVPCTQVHMHWEIPEVDGVTFVMRFKSREAVDSLIDALIENRDYVWPEEGQ